MEKISNDQVQFSKGNNLRGFLSSEMDYHIDMDFKNKPNETFKGDDGLNLESDEDSDTDVIKNIEEKTEKMMLSSPEYHSFEQLSAKMVNCVPNGDVKMLVIEEGDGPLVPVDAEVTIHYAAYWEKEKTPFDSTLTMNFGNPMRIRLGARRILPGLELGLTMVKGPTARFHLLMEPSASWGERGVLPRIKPQTSLFVIALYDVRDVQAAMRFNDLPMEEQAKFEVTMRTVKSIHTEAKELFTRKKYKRAIKNYHQSISILSHSKPQTEDESNQIKKLKVDVYMNLAVCYYKIDKPKYVLNMCENLDRIIDTDNHCKALFYYGRAYEMLSKTDEALKCYKKALKLEPKNKEIGRKLADLDARTKQSTENEKVLWQNAFRSVPEEKKIVYDVDDDFQNGVLEMCQDLAGRDEFTKFDLPTGLTRGEIDCIKSLVNDFKGLAVFENGEGKRKRVTVVKKMI